MSNIDFSILIPAYKAKFLKECIDSILKQTYTSLEVIIVNDDSPEDIDTIVDSYKDNRIKYYKNKKNCGAINVVDNWNKCLKFASGKYVICMGDDDKMLPNCLEEYHSLILENPGIGLLHGWTEIIDENSVPFRLTALRGIRESAMSLCWHRWTGCYRLQFIGDFCFEREWLVKNGGFFKFPLAWASDDISAIIGASKNGVVNTQKVVFQYRESRYTISNTGNEKIKLKAIVEERKWYKDFLSRSVTNEYDSLYRKELITRFEQRFDKKVGLTICPSLRKNRLSFFFWLFQRKRYNISYKAIAYALIQSFK